MSTPVMSKGDRDQAILGSFALRELDDQLNDAIEDLEKTVGPQSAFSSFANEFSNEVRNRVLRLVKENVGDPHVQAAMLKVIRIGRELLDAERAELQNPVTPEEMQKRKDVERFAKFLQEDIAKPIMQAIADVWYAPKVTA